ncbi:antibiotic biosynthesis monooxygenase family protein [Chloroflexota bacterium]
MYASLVMLTLGPGTRSTGEKLADQFAPALKTLKGFKRVTFLGDEAVGEYGSLTLWESKEDAKTAAAVIGPQLEQAVSGIVKGPPTRRFFEVYEPKA